MIEEIFFVKWIFVGINCVLKTTNKHKEIIPAKPNTRNLLMKNYKIENLFLHKSIDYKRKRIYDDDVKN